MKKLAIFALLLCFISPLWAMPPMPGSGLTHDGSIREIDELPATSFFNSDSPASSDSGVMLRSAKYPVSVSSTGNKKILVILAEFPGETRTVHSIKRDEDITEDFPALTFRSGHTADYYKKILETGSGLTMKQYYLDQSRNKLNLSFHILGPYMANHCYAYYGENDLSPHNFNNDKYPYILVKEMLDQAAADPGAPSDLDGCTVIIIHSGPGEEAGTSNPPLNEDAEFCIWSHRDTLKKHDIDPIDVNGTTYNSYLIVPEYNYYHGDYEATIGVFCHEFGHVIGLPDAYDTNYSTTGVGQWSLMGGGSWGSVGTDGFSPGSDPAPFMAWERLALGWIDEEEIELESGESAPYEFSNINDASKVLTVKLTDDQYLLFEGKARNKPGTGMYVMETGLMVTQIHKGILEKYWTANRINNGSGRPHGAMVVEAKAENYKANGLGNLWRSGHTEANRFTTEALFRASTVTSLKPAKNVATASAFLIGILAAWYKKRKKLCALIAIIALATFISTGCVISSGGGGTYDVGPNTNYYMSTTNVHSKTGISGITISNINCNSDGSGSFVISRE